MTGSAERAGLALGGAELPAVAMAAARAALAEGADDRGVHAAIVDALVGSLPADPEGVIDWRAAGPYLRENLTGHAVRAGRLDRLVRDPGFLLTAEPGMLLAGLDAIGTGTAIAEVYRRAFAYLRAEPGQAAAILQLAARRAQLEQLADRIGYLGGLPWSVRWLLVRPERPHQTMAVFPGAVEELRLGRLPDGTPVVAADGWGGPGRRRRVAGQWELLSGAVVQRGAASWGPPARGLLDGRSHGRYDRQLVTTELRTPAGLLRGDATGLLRLWPAGAAANRRSEADAPGELISTANDVASTTLADGREVFVVSHRSGLMGLWEPAMDGATALGAKDSEASRVAVVSNLVVTAHQKGRVKVTDLATGAVLHEFGTPPAARLPGSGAYYKPGTAPGEGEPEPIRDLTAGADSDGRAVAVALGWDGWVHRWTAVTGEELPRTFLGRAGQHVRCAHVDGQVRMLVSTSPNLMVFDLSTGVPIAEHPMVPGHRLRVLDVVGDLVAAVDDDQRLHRWRLHDGGARLRRLGPPTPAHGSQTDTICCGRLTDGRPVAVTGAQDGVLRVWDLTDGRLLHHIPVEEIPVATAVTGGADLFVGVFGGLGVIRLHPVDPASAGSYDDLCGVLDDTWTRDDDCMVWEFGWRVPHSLAAARVAEIERVVPTLLPGFAVTAPDTAHGLLTEGVLPIDLVVWARDAVTETTVPGGARLTLRSRADGDTTRIDLTVAIDLDLYAPRTRGPIPDNDALATLNAPRLNGFLTRLHTRTPYPKQVAVRSMDAYESQVTAHGVPVARRVFAAHELTERLRRGHAVHLTNLPEDGTSYHGPFDSHVTVRPEPPGRYRWTTRLVTNDGSGLSSTTDELITDAELRSRVFALLKDNHTVTEGR